MRHGNLSRLRVTVASAQITAGFTTDTTLIMFDPARKMSLIYITPYSNSTSVFIYRNFRSTRVFRVLVRVYSRIPIVRPSVDRVMIIVVRRLILLKVRRNKNVNSRYFIIPKRYWSLSFTVVNSLRNTYECYWDLQKRVGYEKKKLRPNYITTYVPAKLRS